MVQLIVHILTIAAGVAAIISTYVLIDIGIKWSRRPRFIVGVLPIQPDMTRADQVLDIRTPSVVDEFRFNSKYLARPLKHDRQLRKVKEGASARSLTLTKEGFVELPIIIQNIGRREAERYKLVISLSDSSVRVRNIKTETLIIDGLYIQDGKSLEPSLLVRIPDAKIRDSYKTVGVPGDYVSCMCLAL